MTELAPSERLIVALDYNNAQDALNLVDELEDVVSFYKVGLELFVSEGWGVVKDLLKRKKRVFLDLKIDDIEETISRTVKQVAHMGVDFLTIHGNHATARAAHAAKGSHLKILQITLLTSVNEQDLRDLMLVGDGKRFSSKDEYVLWRAEVSMNCGCDGVIASGQDARMLRQKLGSEALLVCPGMVRKHFLSARGFARRAKGWRTTSGLQRLLPPSRTGRITWW
ncbi:MAG: orotidine-5'-phosphate decarboxylase [Candidatus Hydrogenedentes bacterium]|nr:orotidine-5'-phosphate decarboxylase [Candidatus Hydrogenedentota bacterium]